MEKQRSFTINIDGAARGNPGPAAYGFVISNGGQIVLEENGRMGSATNNVAEYTALVKALDKAVELKADQVLIRSDSELLVRQMNGEYRVKNAKLLPLFQEANRLRQRLQSARFTHVPREQNRRADQLCNEALDGVKGGKSAAPAAVPSLFSEAAPADWEETVIEAEQILRAVGESWIKSGVEEPSPHEVLGKIIQLFEERGFLKHQPES